MSDNFRNTMGFFRIQSGVYNLTDILGEIVNLHILFFSVFNSKMKKMWTRKKIEFGHNLHSDYLRPWLTHLLSMHPFSTP